MTSRQGWSELRSRLEPFSLLGQSCSQLNSVACILCPSACASSVCEVQVQSGSWSAGMGGMCSAALCRVACIASTAQACECALPRAGSPAKAPQAGADHGCVLMCMQGWIWHLLLWQGKMARRQHSRWQDSWNTLGTSGGLSTMRVQHFVTNVHMPVSRVLQVLALCCSPAMRIAHAEYLNACSLGPGASGGRWSLQGSR